VVAEEVAEEVVAEVAEEVAEVVEVVHNLDKRNTILLSNLLC
jgi:hypothetical protein